jgi:replicative DNA helicase
MAIVERTGDSKRERKSAVTAEILDRQPPHSLEAELGVLGSILLLPEVCDDVALLIRSADFYDDANRTLYENMLALHDAGRRIDQTLLVERLRTAGVFDFIGGTAYLIKVVNSVPHAANAAHYAQIVRDKSTLRSLIHSSTDILRDTYDGSYDASSLLNRAEEKIFAILGDRVNTQAISIRDILHQAMERVDRRMNHEHVEGGVETGFHELDSMLGGLRNSELIILAARPSMGKTALALNIAEHSALKADTPTLFISLEMSAIELSDRLLCSAACVNGHRLRNGTISHDDRRKLLEMAGKLSEVPLWIDDSPSRNMTEIAATARRLKRKSNLGLVVIDYLQLIEPDNPQVQRQEQVAKIARRLKGMARELNVPVLCLAQLNRQAETAKENRPRLSHLRESGAIEQDADVVMFVHRDEYYETSDDNRGLAEIVLAKQRNGPTGDVKLIWRADYTRFENRAHEEHEEFTQYSR